jgi:predicted dinucleotide-binding enzyme
MNQAINLRASFEKLYLYGAGQIGKGFARLMVMRGAKSDEFIVSNGHIVD